MVFISAVLVKGGRDRCLTETSEKIFFINLSTRRKALVGTLTEKDFFFLINTIRCMLHYNTS